MSSSTPSNPSPAARGSSPAEDGSADEDRPGRIEAVPVRHPGRWVAIAVIAVLTAMLVHLLLTNEALDWKWVWEGINFAPILKGFWIGTILVTVVSMVVGVAGGVLLAAMRLSSNPVLRGVSWVYTWFFRSVPRFVLLTTMGTLGVLFPNGIALGVPFDWKIIEWLGMDGSWRFLTLDANQVFAGFFCAVLGLGMSEAAYMAEIARAGMLSVDQGQSEAAAAIGMSKGQAMRRIILPQAMRVIIPPTGNETIAMVKDTSLLIAVPLETELFYQTSQLGRSQFLPFLGSVVAVIFYLVVTSIAMVLQSYLERHFGRGFGSQSNKRAFRPAGAGGA